MGVRTMFDMSTELKNRWIWAGVAATLACLALFVLGQEVTFLLALAVGLKGWHEYARMMNLARKPSLHVLGYVLVFFMFTHAFFNGPRTLFWLWTVWFTGFFTFFLEHLWQSRNSPDGASELNVQQTWTDLCRFVLGVCYIFMMVGFVGPIVSLFRGEHILFVSFCAVFIGDSVAYFVGRRWGRRKLWPALSPGKTIEGGLGGVAGSILGALFAWGLLHLLAGKSIPWSQALTIGIVTPVLAQSGDFLESLMKRASGRKDSGSLMPGHGGILDRADGLTFVLPIVYFLSQ